MPPDTERADVNCDGKVNSLDALTILTIAHALLQIRRS